MAKASSFDTVAACGLPVGSGDPEKRRSHPFPDDVPADNRVMPDVDGGLCEMTTWPSHAPRRYFKPEPSSRPFWAMPGSCGAHGSVTPRR